MPGLDNSIVLITGAGRGTGREIALKFAEQGATIAANDISPVNLDETIKLIHQNGGTARDYVIDIAKKMPVQRLINNVLDDWGKIDILINHANVKPKGTVLEMDEWDIQRTVGVNLVAPFLTMQSVGRVMKEQGGGLVLNIIDLSNILWNDKAIALASQMGVLIISRMAEIELSLYGIQVYTILNGDERWLADFIGIRLSNTFQRIQGDIANTAVNVAKSPSSFQPLLFVPQANS